ncbi:GGDEF domain-containing protein [Calycomorphotria hydatis]|uniref:Putative diguanylate cyclase YegE n=1 Tax=Calycomorphotria hydatis TaxID=2528027 RepID=A0A517TD16_9PLAN|nr:GGDEF domain-containing protein [Calycomorphotria hydatis]QDT66270.1 putative diguanylate cyclase YegE [Calycomorphotria hydatis]
MPPATSLDPSFANWIVWILCAGGLLSSGLCGFVIGYYAAKRDPLKELQKASESILKLQQLVLSRLVEAKAACDTLATVGSDAMNKSQLTHIENTRNSLWKSLQNLSSACGLAEMPVEPSESETAEPRNVEVEWITETIDEEVDLPDREAFNNNLQLLLDACEEAGGEAGLLLCKIDRFDRLAKRVGEQAASVLLKQAGRVLIRAVREEDLVCRFSDDAFGILFRGVMGSSARQLASAVRDSVRYHAFRVEADGPEILVTASFGFSPCRPHENSDLVLHRAGDALSRSQKRGRNQLHLHNGAIAAHAPATASPPVPAGAGT